MRDQNRGRATDTEACDQQKMPRLRGTKRFEVGHGFGRLGGGREDGAAVVLQEPEPLREVLCMIGAGCFFRDAKLGTEESGTDFGDEFFGGISGVTEAFPELTVEAMLRA